MSLKFYKISIQMWHMLIENLISQARLREIAEIYLKIADLYAEKLNDPVAERENILKSIGFLIDESEVLKTFNDVRKLVQNYSNIAELYLRINDCRNAVGFFAKVIEISKVNEYIDLLSFSYEQISTCLENLNEFQLANDYILDGIDYFSELFNIAEEKNDFHSIAQLAQILKNLYKRLGNNSQFNIYSKKEAGAYINLAEQLEKTKENFARISNYYKGAALCYKEIKNNLIECASCFVLAGNFAQDPQEAALNYVDAANTFKELENYEMAYRHFVKAGDCFWKAGEVYQSTECYLNAYDIAVEIKLEFDRFGIFNQIIKGLNKVAEEGLKNKQFFTAATLILESIKFYEQLDTAKDFLLRELLRNVYRYYYRAASLKKISLSHIVQSYVLASLSCILIGKLDKAWQIISELDSEGKTVNDYKKMIKIIIERVSEGKQIDIKNFPYKIKNLIKKSEEIKYLIGLFKRL